MGEYVALRNAGGGNLKGLCPFHDEKTPSFQVSPSRGYYHCFGCGKGGDVFAFLQEIEHLTFVESVQRLAERANITLTLIEGGTSTRAERGTRPRLLAANKAAAEFYAEQLSTPGAQTARDFLAERGFDLAAAAHFGCGYAPDGYSLEASAAGSLRNGPAAGPRCASSRSISHSFRAPAVAPPESGCRRGTDWEAYRTTT